MKNYKFTHFNIINIIMNLLYGLSFNQSFLNKIIQIQSHRQCKMEKQNIQVSSDEQEGDEADNKPLNQQLLDRKVDDKNIPNQGCVLLSNYKQEYDKCMSIVPQMTFQQIQGKFGQRFKQNNIIFDPNNFHQWPAITRIDSTINSQIAIYTVRISYFQLTVSIFNLAIPFVNDQSLEFLGGGSYGNIYSINVFGKKYACKNIMYEQRDKIIASQQGKVYSTLMQYSISKICSVLQIGLSIYQALGFDLICYSNCVQFFMQCGTTIELKEATQIQLLQSLSLMHSIKLIHNDIKPENIMFSSTYNRHVFIDFGISEFIGESLGQLSKVVFRGSYNYGTIEMKELFKEKDYGFVDLYFNDLNGLTLTLKQLEINDTLSLPLKNIEQDQNYLKEFHEEIKLGTKIPSQSINFIICVTLMTFCLYTKQPFKEITIKRIQQKIFLPEKFYVEFADIFAQLPPNGFLHDFFKKFIRPFLQQKKIEQHKLFSIYRQSMFVPWLKQDSIKSRIFQSRLIEIDEGTNYHLLILSKPHLVRRFFQKWQLGLPWQQQYPYLMFYLDFMFRNCLKGKQYLIQLMHKKLFEHEQNIIYLDRKTNSNFWINYESIEFMHYMNLVYIERIFPKQLIERLENLWIIYKVLDQFRKLGDIEKMLAIYEFIYTQPLVDSIKPQWFKLTFNVFAEIQKSTDFQSIQLLQIKINQMQAIRQKIINQTDDSQKYHQFITYIFIKIAQFSLLLSKYPHQPSKKKLLKELEIRLQQIQTLYNQKNIQNVVDNNSVQIKILEIKFSISYLKHQSEQIVKFGEQIIDRNNTIEKPSSERKTNRNVANILADTYLEMEDLPQAKKYLYREISYQINEDYFTIFTEQFVKLKIFILEINFSDANQQLVKLKQICEKYGKQKQFVNMIMKISLKYYNLLNGSQLMPFIKSQIQNYFGQVNELPTKQQLNIQFQMCQTDSYRYQIQMILQCEDMQKKDHKSIYDQMVSYRKLYTLALIEQINQNPGQLTPHQMQQIQNSLNQFLNHVENLSSYPPPITLLHFQFTFFSIHINYHSQYSTYQKTKQLFQMMTQLYDFTFSLSALQLWVNWCLFRIRASDSIDDKFELKLKQVFSYVFQTGKEVIMLRKRWYEVVFEYDSYFVFSNAKKYDFSIQVIFKLTTFIKKQKVKRKYLVFFNREICAAFLRLIQKRDKLKLFTQKILDLKPSNHHSCCILWYFLYQRLSSQFAQIDKYDSILFRIIKFYDKLSSLDQVLLQKKLNMLVAERLNYTMKNSEQYGDLQDIKIMGHSFRMEKIRANHRLCLKHHYRSAYSWFESEKEKDHLLNSAIFHLRDACNMYSNFLVSLAIEKIRKKYERHFLNKHTQVNVRYHK